MWYLLSLYVLLLVIAWIASLRFAKLAEKKGYRRDKALKYPWILAVCSAMLMMFGQTVLSYFVSMWAIHAWSIFVVALFLSVLYKAYKNMLAAPVAQNHSQPEEPADAE